MCSQVRYYSDMVQMLLHMRLPERYRCLSGSALKLIAAIIMLIDHVNHHLLAYDSRFAQVVATVGGRYLTPTFLLSMLGRTAFPLYCFLLVEGFLHTHDVRCYARNLLIFALISEAPWNLEHGGILFMPTTQNVFFTLFFGLCALMVMQEFWDRYTRDGTVSLEDTAKTFAGLALVVVAVYLCKADYSIRGVLLIVFIWLFRSMHIPRAAAGVSIMRSKFWTLPAYVLMELYDGTRGFIQGSIWKYAFYAFYPAHILVIAIIKMHLGYV